jgi:hypothetical protein
MAEDLRAQQAARASNPYVVQGSLSERVGVILRASVMGAAAAAEIIDEVRALDPILAGRIWRTFGQYRPDEATIVALVNEVRVLESVKV